MKNRWGILVLIMAAQTMANVGPLGIPAIAPLIRESLGLSVAQAGSFLSAYYTGAALMSLPAGWMADRWGVRGTMVVGQVLIALGLSGVAGAPAFGFLTAMMIGAGAGYGTLNPTTAKAVLGWFPRRQRATVLGFKQMGFPLGGALGALLMPWLALGLGWRTAVLISASVIALLGALTWLGYRDAPGAEDARALSGSGVLRAVLTTRDLWLVALATLIFAGVQTVFLGFLVLYLRDSVGMELRAAAGYLVLAQVMGMVGRAGFGIISDRLLGGRRRIVLMLAGLGTASCSLLMAMTGPGAPAWLLTPLALAVGFFGIGWNGVQHTLMAELAGARGAGTAVGLGLAISSLGVTIWPPLFGLAVQYGGGYAGPWAALAGNMLVALALLIPVREGRMDRP